MKLREYFLCAKKTKINFIHHFILFRVSLRRAFRRTTMQVCSTVDPRGGIYFSVTLLLFFFSWLIMNVHCFYSRLCSIPSSCRLPAPCCPWTMRSLCVAAIWECFHPTMNHGATLQVTHRTQTRTHVHFHFIRLHILTSYVSMKIWAWFVWLYINTGPFSKGFGRKKIKNKMTTLDNILYFCVYIVFVFHT